MNLQNSLSFSCSNALTLDCSYAVSTSVISAKSNHDGPPLGPHMDLMSHKIYLCSDPPGTLGVEWVSLWCLWGPLDCP